MMEDKRPNIDKFHNIGFLEKIRSKIFTFTFGSMKYFII